MTVSLQIPKSPLQKTPSRSYPHNKNKTNMFLKKVSFGEVQVREYNQVMGDHPECFNSCLALGWDYCELPPHADGYATRQEGIYRAESLRLPVTRRLDILRSAGFTLKQIQEASQARFLEQRSWRPRSWRKKLQEKLGHFRRRIRHAREPQRQLTCFIPSSAGLKSILKKTSTVLEIGFLENDTLLLDQDGSSNDSAGNTGNPGLIKL